LQRPFWIIRGSSGVIFLPWTTKYHEGDYYGYF